MKTMQYITMIIFLLFACTAIAQENHKKNTEAEVTPPAGRRWIGVTGSFGSPMHIWSDRTYTGYENWSTGLFMEWESTRDTTLSLDIDSVWRGEMRYFKLSGTIPLSSDQLTDEELKGYEDRGIDKYYTTLDHQQITFLIVRRWIFLPDYYIRPYLELGLGISFTDKLILTDGTIYAFDFVGGGGVEVDLSKKWTLFAGCRAAHFSNGGQMYLTNKAVIGPESLNGVLGVRYELF